MSSQAISILIIAAGAALSALGWWQLSRRKLRFQEQLKCWRETNGVVLDCSVAQVEEFENGELWRPRVRYTFDASGRSIEGDRGRLNAPLDFSDRTGAARWAESRRPGTIVPVWYNPDDPESNTLEMDAPGVASFPFVGVIGIILGITGLIILLFV